ncbi:hypothetical protein [Kitasatospora sp. NPDC097643]|uniref:hypothetical protein n=1 Tax=Kitasatospora sp. NPDC097643 TaxID=3157230 RepID=UPI0033236EBB
MTVNSTAERWTAALEKVYLVPEEYRTGYFDRAAALDLLRCGEEVLDRLVAAGLPSTGEPGDERYDRYDLFNLALASGSAESVPEKAIAYALRWMNQGPESWTAELGWSFAITVECPTGECGEQSSLSHARMLPEAVGGEVHRWDVSPAAARQGEDGRLTLDGAGPLHFEAELSTRGRLMPLRSPVLRGIVDDFMSAGYRWVRVPERLQWDHPRLLAAGVAPCISASLFLAEEFTRAGYQAFARRGWLLGILDLAHSWVEVVDDDGVVKPVDPIAAWLSEYADRPHPELAKAAIGSWLNRQLPAALPADGLMATHSCRGRAVEPRRTTVIRRSSTPVKGPA